MSSTQLAPASLQPKPVFRQISHGAIMLLPLLVGAAIALSPVPAGLPQYAWYYFAIFAAVITGLVVEPIASAAVGLCGVAVAAALARFVLFSPAQVAKPDFNLTGAAVNWALSGFANSTVWLIFAAFNLLPWLREDRPRPQDLATPRVLAGPPPAVAWLRCIAV